jgi:hypothetical protein
MKKPPAIPFLDSTLQLSEVVDRLDSILHSHKGRIPHFPGHTNSDYEKRFQQNNSTGTGAIEVAEEFGLNLDIASNRAFVSSMVLALT